MTSNSLMYLVATPLLSLWVTGEGEKGEVRREVNYLYVSLSF